MDKTPQKLQPFEISQAIQTGLQHHWAGRLPEAEAIYRQVLEVDPNNADVLNSLGIIAYQVGKHEKAIELIDRALAIKPHFAEALASRGNALQALNRYEEALASFDKALSINHEFADALCNRGTALQALKRYEEALASFDKALSIRPNFAEVLSNRGNVLQTLKRYEEALASYDKALSIKPDFPDALNNRAGVLRDLKRHEEALACYDKALAINPDFTLAHLNRAHVLLDLKRQAEAIGAYRKALEHGGNAEEINYELAALGIGSVPTSAPAAYVTDLFDRYAHSFDEHLVSALKYQTPNLLLDQLKRFCRSHNLDVLDLGCGTGLLGPLLRPLARTLTGVDLSSNMLQRAFQRHVYDNLIQSELTKFLEAKKHSFDLAIAADVFNYVGDLTRVFAGLRDALRPGGWFSFSIEAHGGENFVLTPASRYRHSVMYCEKLAIDHGFVIAHIEPTVLRQENGVGVNGYLVLMQRP
jgi:predicted TPR repeat methyltransferase/Flp pilus assembly protein TadD